MKRFISYVLVLCMFLNVGTFLTVHADEISTVYSFLLYFEDNDVVEDCLEIVGSPSYMVGDSTDDIIDDTIYVETECIVRAINDKGITINRVVDNIPLQDSLGDTIWEIKSIGETINISDFTLYKEQGMKQTKEVKLKKGTYIFRTYELGALESLPFRVIVGDGVYQQEISVYLNNKKIEFDVSPVIENGRTLVPVRAIFEAMGMDVGWDQETSSVTASGNGDRILMKIGNHNLTVNGNTVYSDAAPKVIDNRTMIPIRSVVESIGAKVGWDNDNRRVLIEYNPKRRLVPRNGAAEHYYTENENFYIEPYCYAYLDIVDENMKSVYEPLDYTITSDSKNVKVDKYRTLTVGEETDTTSQLILKNKNGIVCDTLNVNVTNTANPNYASIQLKDGNTYNAYQYNFVDGYSDIFRYCNVIFLRPYQSVTLVLRDRQGNPLSDEKKKNLTWEVSGSGIKIDKYNTLSSTGEAVQADLFLKDSKGNRVSHVRVISFDVCQFQPLDFINSETFMNFDNVALRDITAKQSNGEYLVNFDLYNGWYVPLQVSVYNKNEEIVKSVVAGGVWTEVGAVEGFLDGANATKDVFSLKILRDDYINTNLYKKTPVSLEVPRGGYVAIEYPKDGNDAQIACFLSYICRIILSSKDFIDEIKKQGINIDEDELISSLDMNKLMIYFKEKLGSGLTQKTSIELHENLKKHIISSFKDSGNVGNVDNMINELSNSLGEDFVEEFISMMIKDLLLPFAGAAVKESINTAIEKTLQIEFLFLCFDIAFDNLQMQIISKQAHQAQNLENNQIGYLIAPVN